MRGNHLGSLSYLRSAVVQLLCELDLRQVLARMPVVRDEPVEARPRLVFAPRPVLGQVVGGQPAEELVDLSVRLVQLILAFRGE